MSGCRTPVADCGLINRVVNSLYSQLSTANNQCLCWKAHCSTSKVIPRSIGLMSGMIEVTTMPYTIQGGCCSGNGTQAMYYAWHSTVRFKDAVATVNLLLNRASPWMDVSSYLPYEGKVVLKNKQARRATFSTRQKPRSSRSSSAATT